MGFKYKSLISLLAFPILLNAQFPNLKFEHLTVEDGLSSSIVASILQDKQGFIWLATKDGLNKYDGYNFIVYRHDPADTNSLSGNDVAHIYQDYNGTLWISVHYGGGGLTRFNPETETFKRYVHNPDDPTTISANDMEQTVGYRYGEKYILWIGAENGLNKFDVENEEFTYYPLVGKQYPYSYIESLAVDSTGMVWIGTTRDGLYRFDPYREKYTHYPPGPHNYNDPLVFSLMCDREGKIWIGGGEVGGLSVFDPQTEKYSFYRHDPKNPESLSENCVMAMMQDSKGNIWASTPRGGLNLHNRETDIFSHYMHIPGDGKSLGDNSAYGLYEDRSGVLWVGTHKGVSKTDPGKAQFYDIKKIPGNPNSLSDNYIWSLSESRNSKNRVLWAGTKTGGLNRIDLTTSEIRHFVHDPVDPHSLHINSVSALFEDNSGSLWIGTYLGGLAEYNSESGNITRYDNDPEQLYTIIRSITQDKSGRLWMATRLGGLALFDKETGTFVTQSYKKGIEYVMEDTSGILWYGGFTGLEKLNYQSGEYMNWRHNPHDPSTISHNMICMIHESSYQGKRVIWVATKGGLNRFDPQNEKFRHYLVKDGLPNAEINGILEDEQGRLWLSTNNGLSCFNPYTETFRNYDMHDGLLSSQFIERACFKSRDGAMFFGGVNGINYFYPHLIKDNSHIPQIVITNFSIFNQPVHINAKSRSNSENILLTRSLSFTKEIVLSYQDNIFSFEFAALDFRSPQKNKYAYKMEDVDPDWVYTNASRRFATYTNLDPGEYIFKVRGSNNDGIWNNTGTSLKVIIKPPWWQTKLAYFLYILGIIALTISAWRFQIHRLKIRHQMEMNKLRTEKLEEIDRVKSRFFANISHEFRTPLTLILSPVRQMLSGEFSGNFKEQYKMIIRSGERLLHLINQLLDLSKLESGKMKLQPTNIDIVRFTNSLCQAFDSLAIRRQIHLKFSAEQEMQEVYLDPEKYQTVINNLLSNAIKAAPDGGEVEVDLRFAKQELQTAGRIHEKKWISDKFRNNNYEWIQISVSNTGPEIPSDQLDYIFDRFYQAGNMYKKDEEGTGIGLALVKELVELHHGKICIESNSDTKTTFSILLPLGKEHLKPDELTGKNRSKIFSRGPESDILPDKKEESDRTEIKDHHPKTSILIVEDNADLRRHICIHMNHAYSIIEAENGEEGFRLATEKSPEIIISDVMMPVMDGFEFCEKIKTDERTSHIPVILLTARAGQEDKIEGLETGADDYVTKPFDIRELKVRIRNLIEQRRKLMGKFARNADFLIGNIASTSVDEKFIKRILDIIFKHISEADFHMEDLAEESGISRSQLHRKISGVFGQSPGEFLRTIRLKHGAELLKEKTANISEIAYQVGFDNPANFSTSFRRQFGIPPSEYRKNLHNA